MTILLSYVIVRIGRHDILEANNVFDNNEYSNDSDNYSNQHIFKFSFLLHF